MNNLTEPESIENTVVALLLERGTTIATAESCTGGLLSKLITDIPGASKIFPGGVVAYSAQTKTTLLGVAPGLIGEKGAVSHEVAIAMADGAREKVGADIGVGITGLAGPGGDDSELEPGTVFVALATGGASFCERLHLSADREGVRYIAASHALDMVRRYLTGQNVLSD